MTYLKSLWNLLNMRKAILLTEHGQDPFDELSDEYKEQMDDLSKKSSYLKEEYVFNILEIVYKLIYNQLISSSNNNQDNDETEMSNEIDLEDILTEMANEENNSNSFKIDFKKLNLENIKLKHTYQFWKYLVGIYSEKK